MHGAEYALVGQVEQASRRFIRYEGDGGQNLVWFLIPAAGQVCDMREHKPGECASRVDDLHQRHALFAVVVISSSRGNWEEMFAHADDWQKNAVIFKVRHAKCVVASTTHRTGARTTHPIK